ncbi:hypothetical protein CYMTET_14844, partial [Cymbomonas tetramitiformis]
MLRALQRTPLPGISELRRHDEEHVNIQLKSDASGPLSDRRYKMSGEELRRLRREVSQCNIDTSSSHVANLHPYNIDMHTDHNAAWIHGRQCMAGSESERADTSGAEADMGGSVGSRGSENTRRRRARRRELAKRRYGAIGCDDVHTTTHPYTTAAVCAPADGGARALGAVVADAHGPAIAACVPADGVLTAAVCVPADGGAHALGAVVADAHGPAIAACVPADGGVHTLGAVAAGVEFAHAPPSVSVQEGIYTRTIPVITHPHTVPAVIHTPTTTSLHEVGSVMVHTPTVESGQTDHASTSAPTRGLAAVEEERGRIYRVDTRTQSEETNIRAPEAVEAAGLQAPSPSVTSPPSQTPPSRFPAPTGDQAAATAGILRGPEDLNAMYTTDLRALKHEGCLLRDIEKMVGKLPTFPSSEMKKGNEMEELEVLRTAVVKLTEHAYVKTALRTATCREEVLGRMILDIPTLLWMVMDKSLAKPQKLYLEELAPGGSEGEEWQRRFISVNQFMGDLAFSCGISLDALKRLKTELLAAVQGTSETAAAYYTRMSVGWETVNFVADVVEQCTKMSRLELLGTFWAGLTHSTLVGTRLQSLDLDTSYPETWEQKQKQLQRRDTSAILKVRDVATMIEEEKIKEEAALAALIS